MNVAILGAGNIAVMMAQALNGLDDSVGAYAVASRERNRAEQFAREHHIQKAYGSYLELVEDEKVDLVYIATPHSHHYEHARLCLEHGKAVLCEKAFTMNRDQAQELIDLAEKKGLLLAEAIWTRYMPSRIMLQELLEQQVIGKVTSLHANLGYPMLHKERLCKPELAGGALLDVGIYPLNFASMVFGNEVERIEGTCTKLGTGVDSQDSITLIYKDGRMAHLFASMLAATDRAGLIFGEDGYIQVQNINNCEEIRVYRGYTLVQRLEVPEQINGYEYEVLACREALEKGWTECPQMPHSETLRMMEWMDTLREIWGIRYPGE